MHQYETLESIATNRCCFYEATISGTTSNYLEPSEIVQLKIILIVYK
jgi:hypothetical protein